MSLEKRALGCTIQLSQERTPATQNQRLQFAEGGNQVTLPAGLRMAANIQNAGGLSDGVLNLTIWGMTRSLMNQLATLGLQINNLPKNLITLTAGTPGKMSTAFVGYITAAEADFNQMPEPSFQITAHTLGDQAETIVLNLLRGAGPAGLAGMAADAPWPSGAGPRLGRPLLGVSRDEILAYLQKRKIPWRKDATNDEPLFLRNRIRPTLRRWERWRPGFFARMAQTAQIFRDEEEYWRRRLVPSREGHRRKNTPFRLDIAPFLRYPIVEQRRRLRHLFGLAHFESVERVRALAAAPSGGSPRGPLDLPGVRVARAGRFLLFRYRRPGTKSGRRSLQ